MLRSLVLLLACVGAVGCPARTKSDAKNYVLITLDTVRADHLGAYGHREARTPYLDKIAAEGTLFETAIAVAPITMPSHASIMTGQYPWHHGVRNNGNFVLAPEAQTLAEQFKANGYDTGAVVSALVLDSKFGLEQGFRVYDDDLYSGGKQKMFMFKEIKADQAIDKAIALATKELKEPFFLWVHLFDAHADYEPPPPLDVLFLKQPYDGEIAFIDKELERFSKELQAKGLLDRTMTVVTADHGDSLGEHGEKTHGIYIYRATTHIPLIFSGPGVVAQRVTGAVSQVDLAATFLDFAGLAKLPTDGLSLAGTVLSGRGAPSREGVYLESMNPRLHFGWSELRAIDTGDDKAIQAPKPEIYALTSDPKELRNLVGEGVGKSLLAAVGKEFEKDDLSKLKLTAADADTRAMLSALGYVGDASTNTRGDKLDDPKEVAHRWDDLQKCQALVRNNDDAKGAACLEKAVESDPRNWTARITLNTVLQRLGQWERAEKVLTDALELDPNNLKTLENLAQVYKATNRFDKAIEILTRATQLSATDPEPWSVLGDFHQERGKGQDAVAAYSEALKRDEIYIDAYIGIANTFHKADQSDRALKYLEKAREIEPNNMAAWYNTGVIEDKLGHADLALKAYTRATELDPRHAMSHNNLGSLHNRQNKKDLAEKHFVLALQADPNHVEALYNLGTLNMEKRPDVAAGLFAKAVAAKPELVPARHNLGTLLARQGKLDEAAAHFEWIIAHTQKAPPALIALASVWVDKGQPAKARDLLKKAIAQGGDRARAQIRGDAKLAKLAK